MALADKSEPPISVAVSAPGKALFAGGYIILDRAYTALVFGLNARINVLAGEIRTVPGVHLTEIVVESPQFPGASWRYGYHLAAEDGGIKVTQLQVGSVIDPNPFVEFTLSYALTYVARKKKQSPSHSMASARLIVLADNDYYSHPDPKSVAASGDRFACFPAGITETNKTGLGSSAALVTALAAALLSHYLPPDTFDLSREQSKKSLHNLAQAAHCAAQGKVGSGFDVAAAVYGSCVYRRFSPDVLAGLPRVGERGFGDELARLTDEEAGEARRVWDVEIARNSVTLPEGVALRMCDVDCGSQTVGMVKKVLAWREARPDEARTLWDSLQKRNEELTAVLREGRLDELAAAISRTRELVRAMGEASGVPIEPPSQTRLLDALSKVEGVFGGVVPGAGGYDALALLVRDDRDTEARIERLLGEWHLQADEKGAGRVRLLDVKGEMQGVRREQVATYKPWV